ncbi:MAG TPA: bifunctional isocitrate dehydrogenase kinase/phosphatase [Chthoniobacterales bacterium]|nr:bifunctional isocitrate dehydrogenase kinase/phosphatase [Chthoniobacterales bacterium]
MAIKATQPSDSPPLTGGKLAAGCAHAVRDAFADYENKFQEITKRARNRFLARDWQGSFDDAAARLRFYTDVLDALVTRTKTLLGDRLCDRNVWTAIKAVYSSLIVNSPGWEIAESFFNSLTRRIFATEGVDQTIEFVDTDFDFSAGAGPAARFCYRGGSLTRLIVQGLTTSGSEPFELKYWDDLPNSAAEAAVRLETAFVEMAGTTTAASGEWQLELIGNAFYRGRGAYYVGCLRRTNDERCTLPVALCLRYPTERGITLDAVLYGDSDLSVLFSYTRAYFRVDVGRPHELVDYLRELMPHKRRVDLYNAIGFNRHGKTEFYRDFVHHLRNSTDKFTIAQGIPGMVMLVFTLPSYDVVFKLIKDRFDLPKDTTRDEVMRRYRLVFEHDRAGRLVEAHEFEHLRIARDRFEEALLEELKRDAGSIVRVEGDDVVIAHAYVERRIRPLNIFFAEADDTAAAVYARDYGQSIKDMAASNIFPGDLLTKNFGVTRGGRVVFYDYDELCFVTECNFRDLPASTTYEEEISAEPWFSVRENDIFPEEFPRFLAMPEAAWAELRKHHNDLFGAEYWREVQARLRAGEIPEIFPYSPERRLNSVALA